MTRRWTLRLLAGLAAGAVVLSGCSERQEAADTLPEADATPSASEPELPPLGPPDLPMPAEARTQDAAGAEAFVRYYIDLINRTSTVMDAAPLREFSDGCLDCNRIATNTDSDAAAGNRYSGGEITFDEILPPLIKEERASISARIDQSSLSVLDNSGSPIQELGSRSFSDLPAGIGLRWDKNRTSWLITDFTVG